MITKKSAAFTLFELLSVLAIIFLVLGVVTGVKTKVSDRKSEVVAVQDMVQIAEELEHFHLVNNHYPEAFADHHLPEVIAMKVVLAKPACNYEYALDGDHYGLRTKDVYWENSHDLFIE